MTKKHFAILVFDIVGPLACGIHTTHRSRAGIKYQQKNDNSGSLDFLLTEDKWKTLTFFGIFEASSILDFTKSRPCLIMHVDSVEKRLCPNTN